MAENLKASVVICTYNRNRKLKKCLVSVIQQLHSGYEIIIVDDHSDNIISEQLTTFDIDLTKVTVFRNEKNRGLSYSRNKGAEKAKNEIVVFIDDDCVAEENWLSEMMRPFNDFRIAVVFGCIKDPHPMNIPMIAAKGHYKRFRQEGVCNAVASGGGNMAVKKEIYLNRPISGLTLEDWELCHKVIGAGYLVYNNPQAIVLHEHYHNSKTLLKQRYRYGVGQTWFRKKYRTFPLNLQTTVLLAGLISLPLTFFSPTVLKIEILLFLVLLGYLFFKDFRKGEKTFLQAAMSFPIFVLIAIAECYGRVVGLFKKPVQINFATDCVE